MPAKYANNARSILFSAINAGTLNFSLAAGGGAAFPAAGGSDYFYATLIDAENIPEIIKVTSRTDDQFIVVRGQDGTVARAFAAGATVFLGVTKASLEELALKDGSNATGTWPIGISGTAAGNVTKKGGDTGSAVIPNGTTAERPASPTFGEQRANSSTGLMEWWNGTAWTGMSGTGGATGGGTDEAFYENDVLITQSVTIGSKKMLACTISIASPAVITMTNDFVADQPVRFETTGALPVGLDVNSQYFVLAAGLSTASFRVSLTPGGAAVNTSGTQSGTHKCGKIKNAVTGGPVTIANGVTVTVPTGSTLTVV